jgi:SNF2 family DNA or RNA helicase
VNVELTPDQKKIYQKLVKDGFSEEFYLGKAQAAELNIRLQDICIGYEPLKDEDGNISYRVFKENPKLEALIDLLEEIDDNEQVVIWCSRTKAVESIKQRLDKEKISYVVYTGAESSEEKRLAEKAVADKKVRVFLGNIDAGSFGLNALKDFNYTIWYCVNDSPERIHQAQHRILRGESKNPKFAYSLFCAGTVELKQFISNKNGEEFIKFRNTKEDFLYGK